MKAKSKFNHLIPPELILPDDRPDDPKSFQILQKTAQRASKFQIAKQAENPFGLFLILALSPQIVKNCLNGVRDAILAGPLCAPACGDPYYQDPSNKDALNMKVIGGILGQKEPDLALDLLVHVTSVPYNIFLLLLTSSLHLTILNNIVYKSTYKSPEEKRRLAQRINALPDLLQFAEMSFRAELSDFALVNMDKMSPDQMTAAMNRIQPLTSGLPHFTVPNLSMTDDQRLSCAQQAIHVFRMFQLAFLNPTSEFFPLLEREVFLPARILFPTGTTDQSFLTILSTPQGFATYSNALVAELFYGVWKLVVRAQIYRTSTVLWLQMQANMDEKKSISSNPFDYPFPPVQHPSLPLPILSNNVLTTTWPPLKNPIVFKLEFN